MLAKNKLNSIKTLVSWALIDMEIWHEELITVSEKKMKKDVRNVKEKLEEKQENMRVDSVN